MPTLSRKTKLQNAVMDALIVSLKEQPSNSVVLRNALEFLAINARVEQKQPAKRRKRNRAEMSLAQMVEAEKAKQKEASDE